MTRAQQFLIAALLVWAAPWAGASAAPCREETFEQAVYVVCSFDTKVDKLRMFLRKADQRPYANFTALADALTSQKQTLQFAMNGGMYQDDLSPVGLYIEDGQELHPANTADAPAGVKPIPNFYKKPNGIFFISAAGVGVAQTGAFLTLRPSVDFATQSGPMLVIDGSIHPMFIEGSNDRKPRNGVGVSGATEAHFVITKTPVNFHAFARFFRDRLGCRNALFLDGGTAPGLYAPELGRNDAPGHGGFGPIIAVVAPAA